MSDLHIRRSTRDDVPAIVQLIREGMGPGDEVPWTEAFWRWKHDDNPFGRSPCVLAMDGERIGALRAFMRWRWSTDEGPVQAVRAVDTVTHPDYRRQGLFRTLTLRLVEEMRQEGVAFVFNTPNRFSRPGYLKMGWEAAGRVPVTLRPRCLTGLLRGAGVLAAAKSPPDLSCWPSSDRIPRDVLEAVVGLGRRECSGLRTDRSTQYLIWRYQRIPGVRYHAMWKEGPRAALLIFRNRLRRGMAEVTIVEILGSPAEARGLLRDLVRSAPCDHLVASARRGTSARRLLRKSGFVPLPRVGPVLTIRQLGEIPEPDPRQMSNWALTLGDIELF